jgi:hypothetical protein
MKAGKLLGGISRRMAQACWLVSGCVSAVASPAPELLGRIELPNCWGDYPYQFGMNLAGGEMIR